GPLVKNSCPLGWNLTLSTLGPGREATSFRRVRSTTRHRPLPYTSQRPSGLTPSPEIALPVSGRPGKGRYSRPGFTSHTLRVWPARRARRRPSRLTYWAAPVNRSSSRLPQGSHSRVVPSQAVLTRRSPPAAKATQIPL